MLTFVEDGEVMLYLTLYLWQFFAGEINNREVFFTTVC